MLRAVLLHSLYILYTKKTWIKSVLKNLFSFHGGEVWSGQTEALLAAAAQL